MGIFWNSDRRTGAPIDGGCVMLEYDNRVYSDAYVTAYNLGWEAKRNGQTEQHNPYSEAISIGKWNAWLTGFRECTE